MNKMQKGEAYFDTLVRLFPNKEITLHAPFPGRFPDSDSWVVIVDGELIQFTEDTFDQIVKILITLEETK